MDPARRRSAANRRNGSGRPLQRALALTVFIASIVLAYAAGTLSRKVGDAAAVAPDGESVLSGSDPEAELEQARQELANAHASLEIERAASARVRGDLAEAQQQIGRLEQEAELYRGLLDTSVRRSGLSVHSVDIVPSGPEGRFRVRVVLVQKARKYADLAGSIRLGVRGKASGAQRQLAYPDIGVPRGVSSLPVRLRYFQVIEGDIELPAGFTPETLVIEVDVTEGLRQRVTERRNWKV